MKSSLVQNGCLGPLERGNPLRGGQPYYSNLNSKFLINSFFLEGSILSNLNLKSKFSMASFHLGWEREEVNHHI